MRKGGKDRDETSSTQELPAERRQSAGCWSRPVPQEWLDIHAETAPLPRHRRITLHNPSNPAKVPRAMVPPPLLCPTVKVNDSGPLLACRPTASIPPIAIV